MSGGPEILAALAQLRVDLVDRMDRLQDTMTRLRDDIAVNFGSTDAVRRANDNTRNELRALNDVVMAMVRKARSMEDRIQTLESKCATSGTDRAAV